MAGEVQNDLSKGILDSVIETSDEAKAEMERRQQVYVANKLREEISSELRRKAGKAYSDAKWLQAQGKVVQNFSQLKANYASAESINFNDVSEMEISRDSYNRSIFYTAKMNQSAMIANSMLS